MFAKIHEKINESIATVIKCVLFIIDKNICLLYNKLI